MPKQLKSYGSHSVELKLRIKGFNNLNGALHLPPERFTKKNIFATKPKTDNTNKEAHYGYVDNWFIFLINFWNKLPVRQVRW